jgi:hypothetical protein
LFILGVDRKKRALKRSAVPSIFQWTSPSTVERSRLRRDRHQARECRKRKLFEDISNTTQEPEYVAYKIDSFTSELGVGATEEVVPEVEVLNEVPDENMCFERKHVDAEVQTPKCPAYSIHNFENDEAAVHFYTGLETYMKFFFILNTLGPAAFCLKYVYHTVVNVSVPDQFFIVLIKLRRHTTNFELSRMFGIAESVVANIFVTWIIFMYKQWNELNIWPSKDLVKYFAPSSFKRHYPSTRVIIDATECPIKKPKNPTAQQATFSTYKNRNTVKVLVGATPGGLVSYISDSYGGSTSDRQIVERSSLMKMFNEKDSIMADKGFNVQDIFAPLDVHVNIPTFFKKKNRMSGETVMRDRKISSKRVHIERIIGLAKTYKILTEPMNATETKLSTKIIYVCFMLCNFRNNIVPSNA